MFPYLEVSVTISMAASVQLIGLCPIISFVACYPITCLLHTGNKPQEHETAMFGAYLPACFQILHCFLFSPPHFGWRETCVFCSPEKFCLDCSREQELLSTCIICLLLYHRNSKLYFHKAQQCFVCYLSWCWHVHGTRKNHP